MSVMSLIILILSLDETLDSVQFQLPDTPTGGQGTAGPLQVRYGSQWGYVCGDNWTISEGNVACRQMGFTGKIKLI